MFLVRGNKLFLNQTDLGRVVTNNFLFPQDFCNEPDLETGICVGCDMWSRGRPVLAEIHQTAGVYRSPDPEGALTINLPQTRT